MTAQFPQHNSLPAGAGGGYNNQPTAFSGFVGFAPPDFTSQTRSRSGDNRSRPDGQNVQHAIDTLLN
jgi:hypothetical protein